MGDEECDFGAVAVDGCTSCKIDEYWDCTSEGCDGICGDGVIKGTETCDYGLNPNPDDDTILGCVNCQRNTDFECVEETGGDATTYDCDPICGDGNVRGSETCDLG